MSTLDRQAAALWIERVDKVYEDGTHALRAMSLHIPAGAFFGLLGPNGSGKSTLIGMVSGLVRALVHRPRLLILDEPTAGVDLELRRELWTYLRRLHQDEDTTVLLTTHYLEEAAALCERVAFIRHGELRAEGTVDELVDQFGGEDLEDAYLAAMR
jgi:ABC-type multidrug transport system ATPase subunit